jgi:hypothetical protein
VDTAIPVVDSNKLASDAILTTLSARNAEDTGVVYTYDIPTSTIHVTSTVILHIVTLAEVLFEVLIDHVEHTQSISEEIWWLPIHQD